MKSKHLIWLVALIVIASAIRLFQGLPPNFNPIGAIALFGAAYLPRKWMAFVVPVLAMWVGNIILNNTTYSAYFDHFYLFDKGMVSIAVTFSLIVLVAHRILKKVSVLRIILGALSAGVIFYLVTNFQVWLTQGLYPKTAFGLLTCYEAALPFFRNTLAGNLVFSAVLFGSYALATNQKIRWRALTETGA